MINDGVVQVAYNELNLPNRITTQNIDNFYTYDAMGNKLRRNLLCKILLYPQVLITILPLLYRWHGVCRQQPSFRCSYVF